MPVLGLPVGPSRLRIKNESTDKTIEEVNVTATEQGGAEHQIAFPVGIPPTAEMTFGPGEPPLAAETYAVELTWYSPTRGMGTNSCICTHADAYEEYEVTLDLEVGEQVEAIVMKHMLPGGEMLLCEGG